MVSTVNVQFNDTLRRHIDARTSEHDVYSTPSEYIRDLVRRDMEQRKTSFHKEIDSMLLESMQTKMIPYDSKNFVEGRMKRLKEKAKQKPSKKV